MVKLLLWGLIFAIGYFYLKPRLDAGKPREDVLDDEDFITVKVPKKKKQKENHRDTTYHFMYHNL